MSIPDNQLDPQVLFEDGTAPSDAALEAQAPDTLGHYLEHARRGLDRDTGVPED